ncbi:MAG: hypothetical protein M3494_04550 [Actinomycetota bacterium]|jgi:hypothetical protein|nr:hypothetical protein [Rubrobacter sp.]MDQ3507274.1 hypothetical protein [Actinomycetota bacterium]
MTEIVCTAKRAGDFESRTEEYVMAFSVDGTSRTLSVKYLASRAYEINAALDSCVEAIREAISEAELDGLETRPTDEKLSQFSWRAMQSVKYDEGGEKTSKLEL